MQWDLILRPEDAARLTRLKPLAPLRQGRARSRAMRIVWHDAADAPLAKAGLALAERRGSWRLERLRPAGIAQPYITQSDITQSDITQSDITQSATTQSATTQAATTRSDSPQPGAGWPPGGPPPLLAEATTRSGLAEWAASALDHAPSLARLLAEPLVPSAAFEGRALDLTLLHDGETVRLTLLHGVLRTVLRERPASRLLLSGPAAATIQVALLLAGETDLTVPRASLAEAALAAARGAPAPPRALGAPGLSRQFSVAEAFDHIVGHLTDVILYWAPLAAAGGAGPEPVHQMRVATRRLRSALSVFGRAVASPSVAQADAGLKALAAALGPARDWDVFAAGIGADIREAFDADPPQDRPGGIHEGQAVGKLLAAAERRRLAGYEALRQFLAAPSFRQLGIRLAALACARPWEGEIDPTDDAARAALELPLDAFAAAVLGRRLKRVFAEGEDIRHLQTAALHAIRLRAKRLRYAAEFFAALFPAKAGRRFIGRLSMLQERLGTLNDAAVTTDLLAALAGGGAERSFAIGAVRGFVAAGRQSSRADIAEAWKKFRRQEPFWT